MAEDGVSALYFEKGNIKELAEQICRIFRNDDLAEKLSEEAAVRARKNNDGDANYRRLLEIYAEILSRTE